jgi:hypothetical protein
MIAGAERKLREANNALDKLDADHPHLSAERYERLSAKWEAERATAQAKLERLCEQEVGHEVDALFDDDQSEVLARLAEIHAAVAGNITDCARRRRAQGPRAGIRGIRTASPTAAIPSCDLMARADTSP